MNDHKKDTPENPLETMNVRKAGTLFIVLVIFSIIFISGMLYASNGAKVNLHKNTDGGDTVKQPETPPAPAPTEVQPEPEEVLSASDSDVFSVRDNDATRGDGDILLIEYSDFECGFCQRFHSVVKALVDDGSVTWVYRHLPLSFHETADEAAKLADCARIHGGDDLFWTFTDSVFASDSVNTPDPVAAYRKLGLSAGLTDSQMDACLESGSPSSQVVSQHGADAQAYGVNGTPGSFLVNTKTGAVERIPGAFPLEDPTGGPNVRDLISKVRG
ncbi:MAG: DsbA family protein [Candidatus Kaiserbacteria bacterium]|nr:DsbA family protein [Candidatus Kaiserbacteria bacterium]